MISDRRETHFFSIGICVMVVSLFFGYGPKEIAFQFLTSDKVVLDIYSEKDSFGILDGYKAHVKTPVCEDGSCYDVELDFYWDVLGDFIRFDYDRQKPLTKLDHKPFHLIDYEKLQTILETTSPSFIHLRREELVVKPIGNGGDVDAMTGATVQSVKADMVEGAIYTCYTLWHIANGGIIFDIGEHTRKMLDKKLITKFLNSGDSRLIYFLIENMYPEQFGSSIESLLSFSQDFDPYYISRLLDRLPDALFDEPIVQGFFTDRFDEMDNSSQVLFLTRLTDAKLVTVTCESLIEGIRPSKRMNNDLIIKMVVEYVQNDAKTIEKMLDNISKKGVRLSTESYGLLEDAVRFDRSLRKIFKGLLRE